MRIVFMGSPAFAVPALRSLYESNHDIVHVYTQPPKPAHRGKKITPTAVQTWAENHNLPVRAPISLKSTEEKIFFCRLKADVAIVVAYGHILTTDFLTAYPYGCLNIHGSLLPRWRGAAPVQRAILAGDKETGVTIMKLDEGMDTGPYYLKKPYSLTDQTTEQVMADLSTLGASALIDVLSDFSDLIPVNQPDDGITYADKIIKSDGKIDWSQSALTTKHQVQALGKWPGVYAHYKEERFKFHQVSVELIDHQYKPGTIINHSGLAIACGKGVLHVHEIQRDHHKPLSIDDFLRGFSFDHEEAWT
jgi:methionyl-tRNA formyltransferase